MGKGDKKTRRGKINRGSHGNARPHKAHSQAAEASPGKKTASTRVVRRPATRKKTT